MKIIAGIFLFLLAPFALRASDLPEQVLAEINFARTAPQQYAQIIPPLAASPGMCNSALSYVLAMGPIGGRGHKGTDGSQPWDRMARFGKWCGTAGENIDYGVHDARSIVARLIIDDGVSGRGHRKNIFSRDFHVAGAATGFHATYGAMCVIDFAGGFVEAPGRVASRTTAPAPAL